MRDHSFNRPPRIRPHWPSESVELPEPPLAPERAPADWLNLMLPLAGAGIMAGAAAANGGNALLIAVPAGAMALLGAGATLVNRGGAARRAAAQHAERRALFEEQLETQRSRLRRLHENERAARLYLGPDPSELLHIAGAEEPDDLPAPRLWERRPTDDDFLELRMGSGNLAAASQARVPPPSRDGAVDRRLYRLAAEYATLRQVPITVPLARLGSLGLAGPRSATLGLARAMLWQAAALHAPGDLRFVILHEPAHAAEWEWLRWLPHSVPLSNDGSPWARAVAGESEHAARLASDLLDQLSRRRERAARAGAEKNNRDSATPQLLVVVDGVALLRAHPALGEVLRHGAPLGIAALLVVPHWPQIPEACAALLDMEEHGACWTVAGAAWPRERWSPDHVNLIASDRLARRLAGVRLLEGGGAQDIPRAVRLFDLLGVHEEAELAAPRWWAEPPTNSWRPDVPIGAVADGQPIYLDLNESRHGPHGIIAGATGAGKSVLLQSIIAALAATHAPERLQLLLIDFKGGAALGMFAPLPHVAGLVTDLEGRMAERAMTAIKAELRRRKRLLKQVAVEQATKIENIADYRGVAARHGLAPLPNLLIVVDEFDELVRSYPEFVAELIRVVKQGRSLGVHLLLATQQPARAVSDEIRSQLMFFVALRLGGADDSREMLLKPDAAFLPTDVPGRAYFRVGSDVRLFQVAQISGPYRSASAGTPRGPRVSFVQGGRERPVVAAEAPASARRESDLDVLVRALQNAVVGRTPTLAGWQPPQIWQPPLPARLPLAALQPPEASSWPTKPDARSWLRQPIGLLDLPQESRREPFVIGLPDAHLAVIGGPGSGKTTLLRTLVLGLMMQHSPRDLWCYLVDAGGQGLSPLAGAPHVGAHMQARERERVRRLVRMLDATIRERQERLRAADSADLPAYRARTGECLPAILVVIDKVAVLREEFRENHGDGEIMDDLARLARLGRPYGVHLVISADRATDLTYRLLSLLEARIALRLPELHDYADLLGARVSTQIPAHLPGRALIAHPDHGPLDLQVALPSLDMGTLDEGRASEERPGALDGELAAELRERVAAVEAAWAALPLVERVVPAPIELLSDRVTLRSLLAGLPAADNTALASPIGREGLSLGPAWLRLGAETPHALVVGPRRSGKTAALLAAARGLSERHSPETLRLLVLDGPRGGLQALRTLAHTGFYAADEPGATTLAAMLRERPPTGQRWLVLVDDYSLCRERMRSQLTQNYGGPPNLLDALGELVQIGGQHGQHLLLAAGVSYADDNLLRALDGGRAGLVLWPGRYDAGTRLLGVALPLADQRSAEQPPGRALLVHEDEQLLIQVARDE